MKKKFSTLLLFLILLFFKSYSQTTVELEQKIIKSKDSKEKSELLNKLGKAYFKENQIDKAIDCYLVFFNQNIKDDYNLKADSYLYLGKSYTKKRQYAKALEVLNKVFNIENFITDKIILAETYNEIGVIYFYLGSYDDALKYFGKSYTVSVEISNSVLQGQAIANIAAMYDVKGRKDLSAEYYLKALRIFEEQDNKKGMTIIYYNLGSLHTEFGDYKKSLEFHLKSLDLSKSINDTSGIGNSYYGIGVIYKSKNEIDSALFYFQKSYDFYKNTKHSDGIAGALNNIGIMHKELGNYDTAMEFYQLALNEIAKTQDNISLIDSYVRIGEIYNLKNKFSNAETYYLKALNLADSLNILGGKRYANFMISEFYEKNENYKLALKYFKKSTEAKDSILNTEKAEQFNKLNIVYETEKKQKANEFLQNENIITKQKLSLNRLFIFIIAVLLLFSIISAIVFNRHQKLKSKAKSIELEQKLLRSQMNPHFIFNSLVAIQSYIFDNEPMLAGKYLNDFAKLIRLILDNSRQEFITVEKEIETLNFYLELQKMRFENKFDFILNVDNNIELESCAIPPMLAQPIIENAIEHGVKSLKQQGEIKISFTKKGNYIFVEIDDNGEGFQKQAEKADDNSKHKSHAFDILQERLNNYLPEEKSKLTIVSSENGTSISFFTPIKNI
jgi:tetratricopeptide (TPR) repeat protein